MRCPNHIFIFFKQKLPYCVARHSCWQRQQDETEAEELRQLQQKAIAEEQMLLRQAELERTVLDVISKVALGLRVLLPFKSGWISTVVACSWG